MIRIADIIDPALRERVIRALAERQGIGPEEVPHWYEMDDADYAEVLRELNEPDDVEAFQPPPDSRE